MAYHVISMNGRALIICAVLFGFAVTARCAPITYKEISMLLRNGETPRSILEETAGRKLLRPLTAQEEADSMSRGGTAAMMQALRAPAMIASPATASAYQAELNEQKRRALQEQKNAGLQAARSEQAPQPPAATPAPLPVPGGPERPLDLKFISLDGTPVDLANMRGKVVLVHFWASWCAPCMVGVPEVVAAYNKFHDQGFEVIGISLDKSRDDMLKTMAAKGMPWPECFDGKVWKNEIALACDIHTLPVLWLVNKQGIIVSRDARGNLEALVGRLLGE